MARSSAILQYYHALKSNKLREGDVYISAMEFGKFFSVLIQLIRTMKICLNSEFYTLTVTFHPLSQGFANLCNVCVPLPLLR